jgi:RNA polymerase sigma-70 factor (ECF subfamily)
VINRRAIRHCRDVVASSASARFHVDAMSADETDDRTDRLAAMFEQYFDFVWRSVRRFGVPIDAVDDAAQEVFVVASRRLASIEPAKEKAFLFGTAIRIAADARKKSARQTSRTVDDDVQTADDAPGADELVDRKRARAMLDRIVLELPETCRPVFVLYELEGMTMAEIADVLELPAGTVASRLRRARESFERAVARADRGSHD